MRAKNAYHLQRNFIVMPVLRFCCLVFGCFRIPTGTEQEILWAERAPSPLTMSRKGKESSQEGNSVLCRKYQKGDKGETQLFGQRSTVITMAFFPASHTELTIVSAMTL